MLNSAHLSQPIVSQKSEIESFVGFQPDLYNNAPVNYSIDW